MNVNQLLKKLEFYKQNGYGELPILLYDKSKHAFTELDNALLDQNGNLTRQESVVLEYGLSDINVNIDTVIDNKIQDVAKRFIDAISMVSMGSCLEEDCPTSCVACDKISDQIDYAYKSLLEFKSLFRQV